VSRFILDNRPAFPQHEWANDPNINARMREQRGLSMRDYFAAAAISPTLVQAYGSTPDQLAKHAYRIADAMLAEREKAGQS
jgi:hypothetical protein